MGFVKTIIWLKGSFLHSKRPAAGRGIVYPLVHSLNNLPQKSSEKCHSMHSSETFMANSRLFSALASSKRWPLMMLQAAQEVLMLHAVIQNLCIYIYTVHAYVQLEICIYICM